METSVGIKDDANAGRRAVKWFVERILELSKEFADIETSINQKCQEIPHAENILEIPGIGETILPGYLCRDGRYLQV